MLSHYFKIVLQLFVATWFSSASAGAYEDFFRALEVDNAATVSSLLQRGFDPNARDEKGQVALYVAYRSGSLKVADALLQHPDTKIDLRNEAGESPMMMAALRGQRDQVARLLDRGVPPHHTGWSPIHYAATAENGAPVVELLLAKGAPAEARSPNGSTPLMMAARYGSEASVNILLAKGADLKARNERDMGPADFARSVGRDALGARLEALAR
ncbi:MAG: ankyrin repeat domain-containing protein [Aquabacterium sp.]